eukprot:TRINITY_DN6750_c0_g2_i1.p3 TRINITY_DN6750_c0_g2~~TRINITY_DN6750_c0_g2_i1.p3  ORF type:complete len:202 (+),score=-10.44 TRINITY_DN6750_c0_g2_i1:238-843(+)
MFYKFMLEMLEYKKNQHNILYFSIFLVFYKFMLEMLEYKKNQHNILYFSIFLVFYKFMLEMLEYKKNQHNILYFSFFLVKLQILGRLISYLLITFIFFGLKMNFQSMNFFNNYCASTYKINCITIIFLFNICVGSQFVYFFFSFLIYPIFETCSFFFLIIQHPCVFQRVEISSIYFETYSNQYYIISLIRQIRFLIDMLSH